MRKNYKKQTKGYDYRLLTLTVAFVILGILVVADASAPSSLRIFHDKFYLAKQQAASAVMGLVLLFILSVKYLKSG